MKTELLVGIITVALFIIYFIARRRRRKQNKRPVKPGTVVLHQFLPSPLSLSGSPPCLKLETFLRMAKIPYESRYGLKFSKKGKIPWIELNGEEIADSNFCIRFLRNEFKVDIDCSHLSDEAKGLAHSIQTMLEENTYCVSQCSGRLSFFHYYRFSFVMLPSLLSVAAELLIEKHFKGGGGAEGGGGGRVAVELPAPRDRALFYYRFFSPDYAMYTRMQLFGSFSWPLRYVIFYFIQRRCRGDVWSQGIGRHSEQDVYGIAKRDLLAASAVLGEKKFLFGDKPCLADAVLFAFIACATWNCPQSPFAELTKTKATNLERHAQQMKDLYYPDWDEITEKLKSD
ncbi:Failed axon connections-like [Stylophora pistillata]|uniref:Failed axon connections-like n=1 Tax=Stylophora pistillata TaxID=50429 RepID=A0A2B4RYL4_STYPI|nr:Failed axon connections-like [Stylophora pistillata]